MALKDLVLAEQLKKQQAKEAAERPHADALAALKALYKEMMADRELRDYINGEVEMNDDELQIDPGPIMLRVSVDKTGDYQLTYEIKSADDPEVREVEVKTIPDIEAAIAKLLVEYEDE